MFHEGIGFLQALLIIVAASLGSLLMHLVSAKFIYSSRWFADRVASKFMSAPFVKMQTGKLLKKVVEGIAAAVGDVEIPDIGSIVKQLPPEILEKIPPGILEGAKDGGMEGMGQLMGAIEGLVGGKGGTQAGGIPGIGELLDMFKMFGSAGQGETPSGGKSGGYNPGG